MDGKAGQIKNKFKAPEGKYTLHSEKSYGTLPFSNFRSTKMTLAKLECSPAETELVGPWLIFNIGDFINIYKQDSVRKEPHRSLGFPNPSSKPSSPTCHAFLPSKDGNDLLVGMSDGSVSILSLKVQLKQPAGNPGKPKVTENVAPEAEKDGAYCVAVAWVPKSDGLFLVACASGCVYTYRKLAVVGEPTSKFSLSLGSSKKDATPLSMITVGGGSITDMVVSADGARAAVTSRDGALRILDLATGAVVGGMQSYFGALTCCSFSHDGLYLAAGGEDDMVVVYGIKERCSIAHCEGHRSWVSSVRFDPWAPLGLPGCCTGGLYRLVSVGQDAQMCLWDVQSPSEAEPLGSPKPMMRKTGSQASLQVTGWQGAEKTAASSNTGGNGNGGLQTAPSNPQSRPVMKAICPSPARADMLLYEPLMEHRLHLEPLSHVVVSENAIFTADHTGCIRTWLRPGRKA